MAKNKKLRKMGEVMLDLENVLEEMTDSSQHDLQWYEVLNLVHGWLEVHAPHAQEVYSDDGKSPRFYYGPKKIRKKLK